MKQRTLPVEELEAIASKEVGEVLRLTREYYDKTLEDIEKALRIRACQIDAIERGDMSNLPGKVYAIGFVRSYAEYLGIDGTRAVQLFKAQYMDGKVNEVLSFPVPASETKTPPIWLVILSILISILFFIGWGAYNGLDQSPALSIEKVSQDIKDHVEEEILINSPLETGDINKIIVIDPIENMGDNEEQKTGIILNIMNDSWVEIKNADGQIIVSNILEKGEQYFIPDSPSLSMSLGNAANIEIVIDGQALKPLGKDGDVRRDIPLNTSYLKTLEFKDNKEGNP